MRLKKDLCISSPFEMPDVRLALETIRAGAFALLHLGRDAAAARRAVADLYEGTNEAFGVVYAPGFPLADVDLPDQVDRVVLPWGMSVHAPESVERVWQVTSLAEGREAVAAGATAIAVKGSEAAGHVGPDSAFLLFQGLIGLAKEKGVKLYVHGGAGLHTSAAYWALGAQGVIMDSQVALFPETSIPRALRQTLLKLNGGETQLVGGTFRVLRWPAGPHLEPDATEEDALAHLDGLDIERNLLPTGQDFALAHEYVNRHTTLRFFVRAVKEAAYGHLRQAQANPAIRPHSPFAEALGVEFPIIQGPMARVSDEAKFLGQVSAAGALPSLALAMAADGAAQRLLDDASATLAGKPWSVGVIGFMQPQLVDDQIDRCLALEHKPTAAVIAGGRPAQAKRFESAGVRAFLHVQSPGLLDQFMKEGARNFIFEGRESGGHIGPTPSPLLWERMIVHLIDADDPAALTVVFAGGLHDALGSAFVSIMSAALAARGTKVGIVLGSAYLFSPETVEAGAITPTFQDLALKADTTVVLESAKGQETRSLPTPFADFFLAEKARIQALDVPDMAKRTALEELNLGRARIASKGLDRADGLIEVDNDGAREALGAGAAPADEGAGQDRRLVPVSVEEQAERGLFMCGALGALIDRPLPIAELHDTVTTGAVDLIATLEPTVTLERRRRQKGDRTNRVHDPVTEPIAIIGMAGIFPQADNVHEYWRNVVMGVDTTTEVPKSRWDSDVFFDPDTPDTDFTYSKWGSFVTPTEFDPTEFGIPPQSVYSIEPTQLLGLMVAKRALEDAGYTDFKSNCFQDTSVIFGVEAMGELSSAYGSRPGIRQLLGTLPADVAAALPKYTEDSFAGILSNVTSGRISNRLNCGGRNFAVDAACAASLASLDLACQELWADRCNMAICGGVDLHNSVMDYLMFCATHALSHRGYTATFDESGDGLTPGEGAGALILKRLSDAERDGDRIYAVVHSVHGSSDGRSLGLTAPNIAGQTRAVKRAYELADILPSELGLIEAHGTGTTVGDRTELQALTNILLDAGALPGQTFAGSVKTQIGHTKCAAGVASLIRVAYSLHHGVIPPTLHLEKPVRSYNAERSPVKFNANGTATLWNSERRLAGVSGFGFGGTNYHAVLENYRPEVADGPILQSWPGELIVFRGGDLAAAQDQMRQVQKLWDVNRHIPLVDVAYTLALAEGDPQVAFVAKDWADLLAKIEAGLEGKQAPGVSYRDPKPGKVAFLFSGQGSQRVNMARELLVLFPELRRHLERHPEYLEVVFPPAVFTDEAKQAQKLAITDTRNAQPLLGFVDLAIARLLERVGVKADLVAGHSYGELAALAFAGVVPEEDLPGLSRLRAEAILGAVGADPGKMAAVPASAAEVAEWLADEEEVWAVNLNSPRQTVVAGASAALDRFVAKLKEKGKTATVLDVACAFHTPLLKGADEAFAAALKPVELGSGTVAVWSNTTAERYPTQAAAVKARLAQQLVNPVRWADQLEAMHADGARVFVEAGPGGVLTGLARETLKAHADVATIATERAQGGVVAFLEALGRYAMTGREPDFAALFAGREVNRLDLADPDKHAQARTAWIVDGLEALPAAKWREQGYEHLERRTQYTEEQLRQIRAENTGALAPATPQGGSPEEVVQSYLNNVKAVLDDQRDVMLGYLGYQPGARQAAPQAPAAEAAAPAVEAAASTEVEVLEGELITEETDKLALTDLTPELIEEIVIDVVSEKTGYPTEMLGLDMDLEADLSIDSIKRLEIMGSLNERIDLPDPEAMGLAEDDAAEALEHMASIRTLRGMIDWLKEIVVQAQNGEFDEYLNRAKGPDGPAPQLEAAPATPESLIAAAQSARDSHEDVPDEDLSVVRLAIVLDPYPHPDGEPLSIAGKRFALVANGLTPKVKDLLEAQGATVQAVSAAEAETADLKDADGLIMVNLQGSPNPLSLKEVFHFVKASDMGKLHWLMMFDDTAGHLIEADDVKGIADVNGFAGLLKTLQVEYPDKRVRVVDSLRSFDPETLPAQILAEVQDADRFPSVVYDGDSRHRFLPTVQAAEPGEKAESGVEASMADLLDQESVVLCLGGAQGISPDLIARVAQDMPCHYVLVGRTPRDKELADKYADKGNGFDIQKHLIQVEGFSQPKEIKGRVSQILKARSVEEALAKIEAAGATAQYAAVDLHDEAALRALVADLKTEHGHVDAIFHAAAVIEDRLFKDKTWDSFERVYTTKTDPLKVIVDLLDDLKLLVLFSSLATSFGNRGQCDYTAGNSVFDTVSLVLFQRKSTCKTVDIAWGPWRGGLINSTLEAEMKKRGLSLIPVEVGAEFFTHELMVGRAPMLIAMAGKETEIQGFLDQALTAGEVGEALTRRLTD